MLLEIIAMCALIKISKISRATDICEKNDLFHSQTPQVYIQGHGIDCDQIILRIDFNAWVFAELNIRQRRHQNLFFPGVPIRLNQNEVDIESAM